MSGTGIISYGYHLPWYRMNRKSIAAALGALGKGSYTQGEKVVANYDEDSVSMAVNACFDCLKNDNANNVKGLLFASTTAPYRERESAGIIGTALNLNPNIRTADFGDSLKAGTSALLFALDAVKAGHGNFLVCGSDCRQGMPGSNEEMLFGDGAAALLIGNNNAIATLEGSYSVSYDFPDYRRLSGDKYVRSTEDRFSREEGYQKILPEAIKGLMQKCNLEAKDVTKIAYPCTNIREHSSVGSKLGFQPSQIQQPLLALTGEMGTASPLMSLVIALEEANPGDKIIIASYGNGAEALCFKVTDEILKVTNRGRFQKSLANNRKLNSYEKFLVFKGLLQTAVFDELVAGTQISLVWRNRKMIYALHGTRCKKCGTPQYPSQRVCVNPDCQAIDQMEDYSFADKPAKLFSYTLDHASACPNPPLIYGFIDFEGGGRFVFDITDCEPDMLKTGMPMKMSFRRKYLDELRGIVGYYWKAVPERE